MTNPTSVREEIEGLERAYKTAEQGADCDSAFYELQDLALRLAERVERLEAEYTAALNVAAEERSIAAVARQERDEARRDQDAKRDSLCQEIHATLTSRGLWAPKDIHNGADLIMAVAKALDEARREGDELKGRLEDLGYRYQEKP